MLVLPSGRGRRGYRDRLGALPRRPGLGIDVPEGHVPGDQSSATPDPVGGRLRDRGRTPSPRRGASSGGGVGRFLILFFPRFLLKGLYGGKNLETSCTARSSLGSVGLVVFGLSGLRGASREVHRRRRISEDFGVPRFLVGDPLGRYPLALALAFGTVIVEADPPDPDGRMGPARESVQPPSLGSRSLGSNRCLRSTSASSRCCSWCRRGWRRGPRGSTNRRTTPHWSG